MESYPRDFVPWDLLRTRVESHSEEVTKELDSSLFPMHVFWEVMSVVCVVDVPILPRVW